MNVSAGIVRIVIVTRARSVGGSGVHSTARLSSKTGDGHTARAGGTVTDPTIATRMRTATTTNAARILHPHRDLLPRPELQPVPEDVRESEAREAREEIARVREVHDGQARRRGWGRGHRRRRRGGGGAGGGRGGRAGGRGGRGRRPGRGSP